MPDDYTQCSAQTAMASIAVNGCEGEARAKQILAMFTARSAAQSGPATSVQQERECSSTIEHALLKHRKLMQSDPTCTVVEMMLP
eukprot:18482-Heterococcus_DN1.PRE.1